MAVKVYYRHYVVELEEIGLGLIASPSVGQIKVVSKGFINQDDAVAQLHYLLSRAKHYKRFMTIMAIYTNSLDKDDDQ